jgi:ankyrin
MKSLGDDSLPIDVTRDERAETKMITSTESAMMSSQPPQALEDSISPQHITMTRSSVERTVVDYPINADNIVIDRHPQQLGYVTID